MCFATFAGSKHEALEPLFRLVKAMEKVLGMKGMQDTESKDGDWRWRGKGDWVLEGDLELLVLRMRELEGRSCSFRAFVSHCHFVSLFSPHAPFHVCQGQ